MKGKIFGLFIMFIVSLAAIGGLVLADPASDVTIEEVKVDGDVIDSADTNRLDLERDQSISVRVKLSSVADIEDVQVEAYMSGYEYNDHEELSDTSHTFDMEANVTYTKTLSFRLPDNVDEDDYQLRVTISDRDGQSLTQTYSLKVDVPRHSMKIKDVVFSPEGNVKAGRALLTTVRVKNMGERDEEGIKISVSIPSLGLSASDYIDELEDGESTTSEELYLRVPECSETGSYTVDVDVEYDEGYETISTQETIVVTDGDLCVISASTDTTTTTPQTIISIGSQTQDVAAGEGGAIYPITISNAGTESKTYTVSVDGASDWAETRVSPSATNVLSGGEAKTLYVYVSASEDASVGEHLFAVTVSSGSDVLKQITLTGNVVAEGDGSSVGARGVLEVVLFVLVIILVVIGLIIAFNKLKGGDDEEGDEAGQTYY